MSEFKQCPNGHYYQGDHCPYCNGNKVVKIGRSIDNDYIVDNPQVSEHHCQIEYLGNSQYRIVDLRSATGTFVNGNLVEGSCPLKPFDEVFVGGGACALDASFRFKRRRGRDNLKWRGLTT